MRQLFGFLKSKNGATAIEYGLIAALLSVAIVVTLGNVGTKLNTTFANVQGKLK